jgi:subtilisin family serine protease
MYEIINHIQMKNIHFLIMAMSFSLTSLYTAAQTGTAGQPNPYSFYDEGSLIVPETDYSRLLIVFETDLQESSIDGLLQRYPSLRPDLSQTLPWSNKRYFLLIEAVAGNDLKPESYLAALRKEPGLISVCPALWRDGDIAWANELLLLNIENGRLTSSEAEEMIRSYGGKIEEKFGMLKSTTFVVSIPAGADVFHACRELALNENVNFAQPNLYHYGKTGFIPNDPMFSDQWFLNQPSDADIDAPEAWDITTGSTDIAVAVIDGHGYDMGHAEMAGKYISPYNAVDDNNDPSASHSEENHGTPCAGIIGALTNNATGVASVGYNTRVVPIKMGFNYGSGGTFQTSDLVLIRSCEHVMTSPLAIVAVSNSYSMGSWANIQSIRTAFSNMRTDSRGGLGSVVLASTGNDNALNAVAYPFHFAHVVGVGSSDQYDEKSSFSNYGDSTDLAAPGSDIWTIDRTGLQGYSLTNYVDFGGTSAACPVAAGIVGLIASVNPGFTEAQLRNKLYNSCEKVGGYTYSNNPNYSYGTWSPQLGYGRVNAFLAVQGGGSPLSPPTNLLAQVTGNNVYLSWTAPGGGGGTQAELIYDNNVSTGAYKYPGYAMSTHMSPSGPCQVLSLKYYTTSEGSGNQFYAKVFNWAGSQPGTTVLYNSTQTALNGNWVEVDVSGSGINVNGDFVVGFGSFSEDAYLGYDADLNNGRSWDLQESSQTWSTWNEAYLIRAVVLYPTGEREVLGGKLSETLNLASKGETRAFSGPSSHSLAAIPGREIPSRALLGYKVYRDGTALNTAPVSNTWYNDDGLASGTYSYTVTAIYDEGESDPAGPAAANISGSTLDPPLNLQAWATGNNINVSWTSPQAGAEEWISYHDGTFESSFASTNGGSGIAQLFTLTSYPATLGEIRFFTSNYENWGQPLTIYVLDGSGTNVLGGPFTTNGANNNWISRTTNVTINQSSFMIATYNDDPGGPYVGVDDSFFNQSLFFGNHTDGFTELSQLGDYEYVGSHEAKVTYHSKYGRKVTEWLRPGGSPEQQIPADMHIEKVALSAPYPDGRRSLLGFNIYRDGNKLNSATWISTTYLDQGLATGTYNYSVSAVYDEGESAQAGPVQVTVGGSSLEAPANLTGIVNNDQVSLSWTGPGGGSQEELIYDNGETDDGYTYPGFTMSTHMSPSGSCQVLKLYYLTSFDAGGGSFTARIFNWAGSQPGSTLLYESNATAEDGWTTLDISAANLTVTGDFVVGFGSENENTFLAYDPDLNNGRSWDREDATGIWSDWNEAYIIRALVQYTDGSRGIIGNLEEFLGYNLYRNDVKINTNLITSHSISDQVPTWGVYNYNVTAVYDEGESAYSNTFIMSYVFGVEELALLDVSIFPNPATEVLFIRSGHKIFTVELIGMDGKVVVAAAVNDTEYQLDISGSRAGLYLLRIENEKGIATAKILVN